MKKVLYTSNLTIGYQNKNQQKIIANNIDIQLEKGKLVTLIGANGVGKSTLLRTLTGLQKPISGNVFLQEKKIHDFNTKEVAQELSLVLTDKIPQSNLTVFELISLGRQPYTNWLGKLSQTDIEKTHWAIETCGIAHLQNQKCFELSDGQFQIVLIARALAQDTAIIILDEPTTHLDLVHKILVFKLLQKLVLENKKSILFSTHDIELAIQFSDEIIVMTTKKIVQNTVENLIENNVFDTVFEDNTIYFDKKTMRFIVK